MEQIILHYAQLYFIPAFFINMIARAFKNCAKNKFKNIEAYSVSIIIVCTIVWAVLLHLDNLKYRDVLEYIMSISSIACVMYFFGIVKFIQKKGADK